MKHSPFDAIKILKNTDISIHLRVDSAIAKLNLSKEELQQLAQTKFHKGNHYRKGNPLKQAWAEQWCIILIDEISGENQT